MSLSSAGPPGSPDLVARARGGALDALRFAAALFVVVFHFGDEAPVALRGLHGFMERGYLATDFFLILSGFVLAKAYGASVASGRLGLGRFWFKRLARCYPTHLITLGILVVMVVLGGALGFHAANEGRFDLADLPAQVFLLHAFGLGGGEWNIPAWTISALLLCYLTFPTLWRRLFLRISSPWLAALLGLGVLFGAEVLSLLLLGQDQFSLGFQWCLFRAAPLFLVGLSIARIVQTARFGGGVARVIGLGSAAVLLVNAVLLGTDLINILAICGIIVGCGAAPVTRSLPGAEWAARMSFSLFMTHTIAGALWFDLIARLAAPVAHSDLAMWGVWSGAVVFAVLLAGAYHQWIDDPIQRAIQARFFTRRPSPGAVMTPRPVRRPEPAPSA